MTVTPKVSVILPVYNAANTIERSTSSVLKQTLSEFELIVVDDGSTDNTVANLAKFTDPRIRVITQQNGGIVSALRHGIEVSAASYIARIDADDEWDDPDKLRQQTAWLDQHPDCVLVGTYFTVYTPDQPPKKITPPTEDRDIRRMIMLDATFAHPTVMFRKGVAQSAGGYRNRYGKHIEDIDLWLRLGLRGTFHILPLYGLNYYLSAGGISRQHERIQLWNSFRLAMGNIRHRRQYPSVFKAIFRKSKRLVFLFTVSLMKYFRKDTLQ